MARNFGATNGIGTGDSVTTSLTTHATLRTWSWWVKPRATANGEHWNKGNGVEAVSSSASQGLVFKRALTTGYEWRYTAPSTGVWTHILITYNQDAPLTAPIVYYNGVVQTNQSTVTATGAAQTSALQVVVGNRAAADRSYDGTLAEFAIWDRTLTFAEIQALASRVSPLFFPVCLSEYIPLDVPTLSKVRPLWLPAVVGTKPAPHPFRTNAPVTRYHPYFTQLPAAAAYTLDAAAGSYAISGADTINIAARILNAAPGTYAVSGLNSLLVSQRILNAATGSYVVTGADALLVAQRMIAAGAGSYLITGADALLVTARVLNAAPGSYAITGADAILLYTPISAPTDFDLLAEPGVYAITGANALELATRIINVEPGAYAITGANAQDIAARALDAEPGSYDVSGASATLLYTSLTPPSGAILREKRKWRRGSA